MSPVKTQTERIVIQTDRYRIEGDIKLLQNNYHNSLSAYLNNNEDEFFFLENVELVSLDGSGRDWSAPVLMLAKRHIQSVIKSQE
jgi:hypothetical protein